MYLKRHHHDPGEPRWRSRHLHPQRPWQTTTVSPSASSSSPRHVRTPDSTRSAPRSRRCSWTRGVRHCSPVHRSSQEGSADGRRQAHGLRQGARDVRAGPRIRGARRAQHEPKMFSDAPNPANERSTLPSRTRSSPRSTSAARVAAGRERDGPSAPRSAWGSPSAAPIAESRPIRPEELLLPGPRLRTTRSRSTTSRSPTRDRSRSSSRTERSSRSRSSARTWRKTPGS